MSGRKGTGRKAKSLGAGGEAGIFFDDISQKSVTAECQLKHFARGLSPLEREGVLMKQELTKVFKREIENLHRYTKAIFELEVKLWKKSCPTGNSSSLKYKKLVYDNVYLPDKIKEGLVVQEGFTINGEVTLDDIKGFKQLLALKGRELHEMYSKGLKTQIDLSYIYKAALSPSQAPIIQKLQNYTTAKGQRNLYAYCAKALGGRNRLLVSQNNISGWFTSNDPLVQEFVNAVIAAKFVGFQGDQEIINKAAETLMIVFQNQIFTPKILFVFIFYYLRKSQVQQTRRGVYKYPTGVLSELFGVSQTQLFGVMDVMGFIRNPANFSQSPVITARKSARAVGVAGLDGVTTDIIGYVEKDKNNKDGAVVTNYRGNVDESILRDYLMTLTDNTDPKLKRARYIVTGFQYGTLGQVLFSTEICTHFAEYNDKQKSMQKTKQTLSSRVSGRRP
jgi:hypothetical protein